MSIYTITKELKTLSTLAFLQLFLDELSARIVQDKAELIHLERTVQVLQESCEVISEEKQ